MKVFTVAQMVAAERAADASGLTYDQMMETAGRAVAEAIMARHLAAGQRVLVLVGPGNNGGDGLVAGRYLAEAGADVAFYLYKPRDPAADANFAKIQAMGLIAIQAEFDQRYRVLRTRLQGTDILIDALLGTGVTRPIAGELAKLMQQAQAGLDERRHVLADQQRPFLVTIADASGGAEEQRSREDRITSPPHPFTPSPLVVAIDCPSGLNCDTGALDSVAIPADLTVTFAGPKRGHFRFPGAAACGKLVVADIGIHPALPEVAGVQVELVTAATARALLPTRPLSGHKGTFGWVLIAAGSGRYWGAPLLAAQAAYRAGAGLVTLAVPAVVRPSIATQLPEATYLPVTAATTLDEAAAQLLLDNVANRQALLVGPGLGAAGAFLETLLPPVGAERKPSLPPLVVDADGLNWLAGRSDWPQRLPPQTILTPHPGEMARLVGVDVAALKETDRVELAQEKAAAWGHVLVLKGAYTVMAAPDGRCALLPFANPALAIAGSGDVLAGVIVALLGQGLPPYEAAVLGGYLHAAAGQSAGVDAGLLAGEIANRIPQVRQRLLSPSPPPPLPTRARGDSRPLSLRGKG